MSLVSIITRTKDRPILLRRAAGSVAGQTFRDLEWIIVNDGGEPAEVDSVVEECRGHMHNVKVIHNETCQGMEAASNKGIARAVGRYLVIHDDDDSWQPEFLQRTTEFLESDNNRSYMGVVTRSMSIEEEIINERVVEKKRKIYNPDLSSITLFQMAQLRNVPPPISFLYRREVLETTGLYREDLPVLGDWDFNLRFLRYYDIGVIREPLANYHIRKTGTDTIYSNTVTGGIDRHIRYAALLRNEYLRNDLDENRLGTGFIVNLCHEIDLIKKDVNRANLVLKLKNLLRTIRR